MSGHREIKGGIVMVLKIMRELDEMLADKKKDIEYIDRLKKTKDKVKYLRFVKRYTQEEAADLIGISCRQVQKVEKTLKSLESYNGEIKVY